MDFIKMHGAGNDFVLTQASTWEEAGTFQVYAEWLCNRNFGIGGDGLIITGPDPDFDIFMRIFNSDGSEPEMCGNGIRCVARYAYEHSLAPSTHLTVRTLAGPRYPEVILEKGQAVSVKVDMGEPILQRELIPVAGKGDIIGVQLDIPRAAFAATTVSMGNPHCIIFVDNVDAVPVSEWGPLVENHAMFPARTNVEFVEIVNPGEIIMRVWERGAGVTLACGTGACATLVAAVLNGKSQRRSIIHLLGGDLLIEWNEIDNHVYMTGPAQEVFSGQVDLGRLEQYQSKVD
ncbi:MAG: diaminopimelate epimerase [Syntrophomonadaceae bacterium]